MGELTIKTLWTDRITKQEIDDFCDVVNTVFGHFCTEDYFKCKYLDNVYGPSLLILVYEDDKPIGANSLWRNDINGKKAFYSAETSVKQSDHSVTVFAVMLKTIIEFAMQQKDVLLYTFPNSNSFPGFKKMKWQVKQIRKVFFFSGLSSKNMLPHIDHQYAAWWMRGLKDIYQIKRLGQYYLIKKVPAKGVARVLGSCDEQTASLFSRPKECIVLLYCASEKKTFYNKRWPSIPLVFTNGEVSQIPFYKMDSL